MDLSPHQPLFELQANSHAPSRAASASRLATTRSIASSFPATLATALSNSLGPNDDAALPLVNKPSAYKRSMSNAALSSSRSAILVCNAARSHCSTRTQPGTQVHEARQVMPLEIWRAASAGEVSAFRTLGPVARRRAKAGCQR